MLSVLKRCVEVLKPMSWRCRTRHTCEDAAGGGTSLAADGRRDLRCNSSKLIQSTHQTMSVYFFSNAPCTTRSSLRWQAADSRADYVCGQKSGLGVAVDGRDLVGVYPRGVVAGFGQQIRYRTVTTCHSVSLFADLFIA